MSGIYVEPCACLPTCPRGDNMRRGHGWRVLVKPAEWDIREGSVRGWPRVFKGKRRGGYR